MAAYNNYWKGYIRNQCHSSHGNLVMHNVGTRVGLEKIQDWLLQNRKQCQVNGLTSSETQALGRRHCKNGHQPITE